MIYLISSLLYDHKELVHNDCHFLNSPFLQNIIPITIVYSRVGINPKLVYFELSQTEVISLSSCGFRLLRSQICWLACFWQKTGQLFENTVKPKTKKIYKMVQFSVKFQNSDFVKGTSSYINSFQQIQGRYKLALNCWAENILKHYFTCNNASRICLIRGKSNVSVLTWVWFLYHFPITSSFRSKELVLFSMGISSLCIL